MSDIQKQVQEAIDKIVRSGPERGPQVAAYRRGEQVVDAVAGVAGPITGRMFVLETSSYDYSNGKGATASIQDQGRSN